MDGVEMGERKTIAVVGATGSQGGGLVEAILADPAGGFAVRALTRDVTSADAKALAAAGADVVAADLEDTASMAAAFDGAHGAFVVTNYWAPQSAEDSIRRSLAQRELDQAEAAALAAAKAGVAHVVFSTLEGTWPHFGLEGRVPVIDGHYTVPHFDAKAEAEAFFAGVPTTFLRTTLFYEGFADALAPRRGDDGRLVLSLPIGDARMSGIAVGDIGRVAHALFHRGEDAIGTTVSIAGDHLTGEQYASALSDALGEPVTFRAVDPDDFRAQGFPGAVEMGNMFQFYAETSADFVAARDLDAVRALYPGLQSFRDWAARHIGEIAVD